MPDEREPTKAVAKIERKELAIVKPDDYMLLTISETRLEKTRRMLSGRALGIFDLERISLPSGKGKPEWSIVSGEGEEFAQEVSGVILDIKNWRTWYRIPFAESGGGSPPDCSSENALTGFGDRTLEGGSSDLGPHDCLTCPNAKFGTDRRGGGGKGQDCNEKRAIFLLKSTGILPSLMVLPPTSLRIVERLVYTIVNKYGSYSDVEITFGIERDKNESGITYSTVAPKISRTIPEDVATRFEIWEETFMEALKRVKASEMTQDME